MPSAKEMPLDDIKNLSEDVYTYEATRNHMCSHGLGQTLNVRANKHAPPF
jgi:hypothetical protein